MIVYSAGTVLSIFLAYISIHIKRSPSATLTQKTVISKCAAFLSFVPLTVIMAVRRGVGTDFWGYWQAYTNSKVNFEIGFRYLCAVLNKISSNPQLLFIVCGIFICGAYYLRIFRESKSPMVSILLFILCLDYFSAMNAVRQYMAIGILLLSIPSIKRRKWIKVALYLLVAFLFHETAVIFAVLIFFFVVQVPPFVAAVTWVICFAASGLIFDLLLPLLQNYSRLFVYIDSIKYGNFTSNFNWSNMLIMLSFFLLLSYLYKSVEKNDDLRLLYSAVLSCLIIGAFSALLPMNSDRLLWYMTPFIILYVPELTMQIENKKLSHMILFAIIGSYALYNGIRLYNGWSKVLPYVAMWDL